MTYLKPLTLIGAALAFTAVPGAAQMYRASNANPHGEQLVAVYIGASNLGGAFPGLSEAVDTMKVLLQVRAAAQGQQFRAVGVALDWSPAVGLSYLNSFGAFDEVNAGRNWFSLGAQQLLWGDTTVRTNVPQVLVYRQRVDVTGPRVAFGPSTVVRQVVGIDSIVAWARAGAPLP